MSRLENFARPVLEPLILQPNARRALTLDDQAALVAWCTKMGIVFEHTVASNRGRFYTRGEHRAFVDTLTPPEGVYIWIAQYRGRRRGHSSVHNYNLRFRGQDPRHVQAITITIQHFVLQVLAGRWHESRRLDFDSRPRGRWRDVAMELWPSRDVELHWPPPRALTDQTLRTFTDRWANGISFRR